MILSFDKNAIALEYLTEYNAFQYLIYELFTVSLNLSIQDKDFGVLENSMVKRKHYYNVYIVSC